MDDEKSEPAGFRNLFGEVWLAAEKRKGRPSFEWTEENSNKVSMLLAAGWSNKRIADVVIDPRTGKSISVPTLKRHFRSELQVRDAARDRLEAARLLRVWTQAQSGNVGAERLFVQLLDRNDRMEAERKLGDAPKPERLGKKEISASRAMDADAELAAELELEVKNVRH